MSLTIFAVHAMIKKGIQKVNEASTVIVFFLLKTSFKNVYGPQYKTKPGPVNVLTQNNFSMVSKY